MSEKSYSIDDIIKEIQENKLNDEDLARYAKDYQKYDTTALLDDVLGRKSDDLLAGIPVSDSELTEEENKLLEQILSGEEPLVEEKKPEPKLMPASEKGGKPMIKPLRPVSETPEAQSFAPLQKTPATAHGKDFAVHRDSVTGLISKVDIQEEAQRQARAALEERESQKVAKRLSGYKRKRMPRGLHGRKNRLPKRRQSRSERRRPKCLCRMAASIQSGRVHFTLT